MKKVNKLKKGGILKASIVFLICFSVIMITPSSAVQITMSQSDPSSPPGMNYGENVKKHGTMRNMLNIFGSELRSKTVPNTSIYSCGDNSAYLKQAAIAGKILPILEESYQNDSKAIEATKDSLTELESKKIETTNQMEKTKTELDNFEMNSNNINNYTRLKKEYNYYQNLQKTIKITKSDTKRMNKILNKKQSHTKSCIIALKQIKKSENLKSAAKSYNKNMKSLTVISNNMAAELQEKKEILKLSNNTLNTEINETSNTKTNSSSRDKVTEALKYTGIGIGSLTGATCVATIASLVAYGVTSSSAVSAINTATAAAATYTSLVTNIFSSSQIYAAQPAFLKLVTTARLSEAAIATSELAGMVSTIIVVVAVVLVIVTVAIMIAYSGYKFHWW